MRGGVILSSISIAGCTEDNSGDGDSNPEDSNSGDESSDSEEPTVREDIEQAVEALQRAGDALDEEVEDLQSADPESGAEINTAEVYGYLDTADARVDSAEEDATAEQMEQIDALRGYVSFTREFTKSIEIYVDTLNNLSTAYSYFDSERFSDAESQFNTAEQTASDADEQLVLVRDEYEDLETDELDDFDRVEFEAFDEDLTDLEEFADAFISLSNGMKHFSAGMVDYTDAEDELDAENYSEAASKFSDASNDFGTANSIFTDSEDSAPSSLVSSFIDMSCRAGALRDASQHFTNASEAIEDGDNQRANEELEAAQEAADRCD